MDDFPDLFTPYSPYSYRQISRGSFFLGKRRYAIVYEDNDIQVIDNVAESEIKVIVDLMNTSYRAGAYDAYSRISMHRAILRTTNYTKPARSKNWPWE